MHRIRDEARAFGTKSEPIGGVREGGLLLQVESSSQTLRESTNECHNLPGGGPHSLDLENGIVPLWFSLATYPGNDSDKDHSCGSADSSQGFLAIRIACNCLLPARSRRGPVPLQAIHKRQTLSRPRAHRRRRGDCGIDSD